MPELTNRKWRYRRIYLSLLLASLPVVGHADTEGTQGIVVRADGYTGDIQVGPDTYRNEASERSSLLFARAPNGDLVYGGVAEVSEDPSLQSSFSTDDSLVLSYLFRTPDLNDFSLRAGNFSVSSDFNSGKPLTIPQGASGSPGYLAMAVDTKNRILVLQPEERPEGFATSHGFFPIRRLADGSPDSTFKYDETKYGAIWEISENEVPSIFAAPDGGVFISGQAQWATWVSLASASVPLVPTLMKLREDGTPDPTFGSNGLVEVPIPGSTNTSNPGTILTTQFNGSSFYFLVTQPSNTNFLAHFGLDGKPVVEFGKGGWVSLPTMFLSSLGRQKASLFIRNNVGFLITSGGFNESLMALDPKGAPLAGFGKSGVATTPWVTSALDVPGFGMVVALQGNGACDLRKLGDDGSLQYIPPFTRDGVSFSPWSLPYTDGCGYVQLLPSTVTDLWIVAAVLGVYQNENQSST